MPLEFARLGEAIRARATELYGEKQPQEDLIQRSTVSRSTVQRLWGGTATNRPGDKTRAALERELRWEEGSIAEILDGGVPTPIREPASEETTPTTNTPGDASASMPLSGISTVPLSVRVGLTDGETLDYERIDWNVGGTDLRLYIIVKAGDIASEDELATVRKQMDEWARIKKGIHDVIRNPPDDTSATTDD